MSSHWNVLSFNDLFFLHSLFSLLYVPGGYRWEDKWKVSPNNDKGQFKGYFILHCLQKKKSHVFVNMIQVKSPITSPSSLCNSPSVLNRANCFLWFPKLLSQFQVCCKMCCFFSKYLFQSSKRGMFLHPSRMSPYQIFCFDQSSSSLQNYLLGTWRIDQKLTEGKVYIAICLHLHFLAHG